MNSIRNSTNTTNNNNNNNNNVPTITNTDNNTTMNMNNMKIKIFQGTLPPQRRFFDRTESYDPTYAIDIYKYRIKNEGNLVSKGPIFGRAYKQPELRPWTRQVLVDWLIDVTETYKVHTNTLHLTVSLIDASLKVLEIPLKKFQLLGCSCLLIASKLDEVQAVSVENLVYIADFCFDSEDLISMESNVILALDFQLMLPTRYYFGIRLSSAAKLTPKETHFLIFLLEVSLLDIEFNSYTPSMIAAAALHMTLQILRPRKSVLWPAHIESHSGYAEKDFVDILIMLAQFHWGLEETNCKNVLKKYDKQAFNNVSRIMAIKISDIRFDNSVLLEALTLK